MIGGYRDWFVRESVARVAGLGLALTALLYTMRPTFEIPFGIIDDHEILDIIGRRGRLPILEIPNAVFSRSNESLGRFRPGYYLGRVVEAAAAGQNPRYWFFDRFLLAAIVLVAIYVTAVRFMSPLLAALISLLPFVGPQFETWGRLGPNEAYALPLMCVGLALVVRGVGQGRGPAKLWLGYAFLTLAALAKENFVLVSMVVVMLTALKFGIRRLSRVDWWVVGGALAVGVLDLVMMVVKIKEYGTQYPQARTRQTLESWYHYAIDNQNRSAYLYSGLLLAAVMFALTVGRWPSVKRLLPYAGVVLLLASLQIAFYAGAPQVGRYLYPIALVPVFVWGFVGALCREAGSRPASLIATGVVSITLLLAIAQGVHVARRGSEGTAAANVAFEAALSTIETDAVKSGAEAIVLQPSEPVTDVERVLSLARFISAQTDLKVMTLQATHPSDAFSQKLGRMIQAWSVHGTGRLAPYVPSQHCLSIIFGPNQPVCALAAPPPG